MAEKFLDMEWLAIIGWLLADLLEQETGLARKGLEGSERF